MKKYLVHKVYSPETPYYFYLTICKPTGEFYYGSGSAKNYLGSGKELKKRIEEYGPDEFEHVRLRYFEKRKVAYTFEDKFLRIYKVRTLENCLNITKGASGYEVTKEIRKKMSAAKKGKPSPNKGRTFSEEARRKMSAAHKGRTSPNKGKTFSEEHRRKLRESIGKGENNHRYDHTIYHFIHKDGREFVGTRYQFRTTYNFLQEYNVCRVIKGTLKSHKGWSLVS